MQIMANKEYNLDLRDQKIIYELEKDARTSVSDIAKRLKTSKQLVSYKIKKLEENKVIEGYHAIIDTSRLGFTSYRVYLKFQNLTLKKREEILAFLTNLNEVTILLTIDGRWDVGFAIMVKYIYNFYEVWGRIIQYKQFIELYHISIYSPIYHFTRKFLSLDKNVIPKILILGGKEKAEFDELDIQILKELSPNARKPLTEISNKLKKPIQSIINRVKSLEKRQIIQGYRPILNWNLLGYDYYKVDISLSSHKREQELFIFCKLHKFIFQVDKTIGGSDFELELYAKNKKHFREIMQEIQNKFNDVFKNYAYFTLIKTYKETFFPN